MPNEGSYEAALERSNKIQTDIESGKTEGYTMLTGDRPTGRLHLGHYFGTIRERVRLQNLGVKTNIVIADYQVITDRDTTEHIRDNVYNMVMDYLACGIDPEKTMIFTHSAVPAENQLMLPFLSLVSKSELERNPTVKAEQEASGHTLTGLLLTYPVHQACDILFCKGNIVPVGRDPKEIADEIGMGGAGQLKRYTTEAVNTYFAPIREKRHKYENDLPYIQDVLHEGNRKAQEVAEKTLEEVREAMGMVY